MADQENPVEVLRRAAQLMRTRAQAAARVTPPPWRQGAEPGGDDDGPDGTWEKTSEVWSWGETDGEAWAEPVIVDCGSPAVAEHIAGWHPNVALGVAEMLDLAAGRWGSMGHSFTGACALETARAFLAGVVHRDVDRPVLPAGRGHCPACRQLDGSPAPQPCPVHATPAGDTATGSDDRTMSQ